MLSGPGGDARANAISRLATSSVGAEPAAWPLTRSAGTVYISGVSVLLRATGTWS